MFEGQQINLVLNKYFSPAWEITNFNELQTPFLCVGANLFNGDAEILREGYLPMAIRSSMSIPGYFTPTHYNGMYLVDGGIVNNYPAIPVQEMGAQLLVGCDLQSGLSDTISELSSLAEIISQIIFFHGVEANEETNKALDLNFHLDVQAGMLDFDKYEQTIAYGEAQARLYYNEIKQLADSLNAIENMPIKEYVTKPLDSLDIADVIYEGNKQMSLIYLNNFFGKFRNSKISLNELELAITRVYGTQFFKHVFYEVRKAPDGKVNLIIKLEEAPTGYISASIHYDLDYHGSIRLNGIFRNILGNRSKLLTELVMGSNPRLKTLYTISNGAKPSFGIEFDLFRFHFDDYNIETFKKTTSYSISSFKPSAFVTSTIANIYNFRLGFEYEFSGINQEIVGLEDFDFSANDEFAIFFARFKADTREKLYFATRGFNTELKCQYVKPTSTEGWGKLSTDILMMYLKYDHYSKLHKRLTINPGIFIGGMRENDNPAPQYQYAFGGINDINYISTFVPFTGYRFIQAFGYYAAIARLKLQYNVYEKLYLIARADFGNIEYKIKDVFDIDNSKLGYGLTAAYNSFIGPIEFTVMGAKHDPSISFAVNVGYNF